MGQREHHPAIAGSVSFAPPSTTVRLLKAVDLLHGADAFSNPSSGGCPETYHDVDAQSLNDSPMNRPARLKQYFLVCLERRLRR